MTTEALLGGLGNIFKGTSLAVELMHVPETGRRPLELPSATLALSGMLSRPLSMGCRRAVLDGVGGLYQVMCQQRLDRGIKAGWTRSTPRNLA